MSHVRARSMMFLTKFVGNSSKHDRARAKRDECHAGCQKKKKEERNGKKHNQIVDLRSLSGNNLLHRTFLSETSGNG